MLISTAHASTDIAAVAPNAGDTFWMNMGLIGVMFVLFYLLLIRPQQKRLREQRTMLDGLNLGDGVVTSGGLIGTVSKLISDTEVEINLGSVKVVALRYTIQTKMDDGMAASKAEAKEKQPKKKKIPLKKAVAKKAPAKKKAAAKKTPKKK
ncbi:MAG: preprotein translocase subunit YajC [Alphaproteobacteria bacterium]|nr:MAG: preprotein translocase subunit YajC [Alphaproteobacteria bacterium]